MVTTIVSDRGHRFKMCETYGKSSIDGIPNGTSRPTYLLREPYRAGKKVRKRTLASLSTPSDEQIKSIRAVLSAKRIRAVKQL